MNAQYLVKMRSWDPRMRRAIVAYVDEADGMGLRRSVACDSRHRDDALCGRLTAGGMN